MQAPQEFSNYVEHRFGRAGLWENMLRGFNIRHHIAFYFWQNIEWLSYHWAIALALMYV